MLNLDQCPLVITATNAPKPHSLMKECAVPYSVYNKSGPKILDINDENTFHLINTNDVHVLLARNASSAGAIITREPQSYRPARQSMAKAMVAAAWEMGLRSLVFEGTDPSLIIEACLVCEYNKIEYSRPDNVEGLNFRLSNMRCQTADISYKIQPSALCPKTVSENINTCRNAQETQVRSTVMYDMNRTTNSPEPKPLQARSLHTLNK